jgi:transcriptional regulator GlxA family with amidase domain
MHVVLFLPGDFYSAIASAFVETLQAVNDVRGEEAFTFEFISRSRRAQSKSGVVFPTKSRPSRKMDVLVLLTGVTTNVAESVRELEQETERAKSLVLLAKRQDARLAATCGASYILANLGLLNGKCATISWWLKREVSLRFPLVKWQPSRIIVRDGLFYTTGAAFAGLELITSLVRDLGFAKEERLVRKLMVLPPARESQDPYEVPGVQESTSFEKRLRRLDIVGVDKSDRIRDLLPCRIRRRCFVWKTLLQEDGDDCGRVSPGTTRSAKSPTGDRLKLRAKCDL